MDLPLPLSGGRTPLKDIHNRPSVFFSQSQNLEKCPPRATVTGQDIMQARIDQLERDKVDLTLQLHIREEKDRNRIMTIEQLEAHIKADDDKRVQCEQFVESLKASQFLLIIEKDKLENEVRRLTRQEASNDSSSLWQKMTAASRELRRAEDEAGAAKLENAELLESNKKLTSQMEGMKDQLKEHECNNEKFRIEQENALQSNIKLEVLQAEHQTMSNHLTASELARHEAMEKSSREVEKLTVEKKLLSEELKNLKSEMTQQKSVRVRTLEEFDDANDMPQVDETVASEIIEFLKKKLSVSETKRRQLHNQLQVRMRCQWPDNDSADKYCICTTGYSRKRSCIRPLPSVSPLRRGRSYWRQALP